MARYVDGFVIAIPKKNRAKYKKMAQDGRKVWKKFGALDYKECRLDDLKPGGQLSNFPKFFKLKSTEELWFSFITYKSKKHRNEVNKKVFAYFAKKYTNQTSMPFEMNRMATAGFKVEVDY